MNEITKFSNPLKQGMVTFQDVIKHLTEQDLFIKSIINFSHGYDQTIISFARLPENEKDKSDGRFIYFAKGNKIENIRFLKTGIVLIDQSAIEKINGFSKDVIYVIVKDAEQAWISTANRFYKSFNEQYVKYLDWHNDRFQSKEHELNVYHLFGSKPIMGAYNMIGKDGFGYKQDENQRWQKVPHLGFVWIGDDVSIGNGVSIDRATIGLTKIEHGVKIDNNVHIAHNVVIGNDSLIIANAMIGGSATIGYNCWIGPGACINNQITIGDNVLIGTGSVVTKNVPSGQVWAGNPARYMRENLKLIKE